MWSSTQIPHILRVMLALITGIPEHKLRVIAPDVGGGFGGKLQVTPEEVLSLLVARRLGKPVKWTETRSESLMTAHHGRDQIQYIDIAADREGNVKGLRCRILADMGAYLRLVTPGVPVLGAFMFAGIYKFPAYRFECDGVFTNKVPTDAYRGAGRPEATFAVERIMDELAVELGMDPLELRRKNWIKAEEFPFTTVGGARVRQRRLRRGHRAGAASCSATTSCAPSSGGAGSRTTRCSWASASPPSPRCAAWRRPGCWARCPTAPAAGSTPRSGCCPPARSRSSPAPPRTGRGTRRRGASSSPTSSACPFEDVEVLHGDTAISPRGLDTYGSRSLVVGGAAVVKAAREGGRQGPQGRRAPARGQRGRPGVRRRDVLRPGHAGHRHLHPGARAGRRSPRTTSPRGWSPRSTPTRPSTRTTSPSRTARTSAPWRSTPRPGMVKIRKYACVDDVGTIVNPLIVEGQVHGGLAQGIAQALYEEAIYDADGNLTTGTFVDYLVPSAADLPHFDTGNTVHAAPGNPIGAKGVGEAGCIATTPAVVNAALDAVRHLGVSDIRDAADPGTRLAGDPPGRRRRRPRHRRHQRLRRRADRDHRRRVRRRRRRRGPMIPAAFAYARPTTVDEALQALADGGDDVKVLAGGQSLIPVMRLRLAAPETVVDLGPGRGAARGPGGRRRARHRRDDHARRRPRRPADRAVRAAARPGDGDRGRPAGAPPRHLRRRPGARRPGR